MSIPPTNVHILTAGFSSPNGRAFLMPLILHRQALEDAGISVKLFRGRTAELTHCDVLIVDSKYHSPRWAAESDAVMEEFEDFRDQVRCVIFADILDSAGWDHARPLPLVTLYCKAQLLKDRSAYLKPLYGYRIFSDYYHRKPGIEDDEPVRSEPVADPGDLEKLTVGWNSGLADYSWLGPYRMAGYERVHLPAFIRFPDNFHVPSGARAKDVSCRIGTGYLRKSAAYQRQRLAEILRKRLETAKLSRRRYLSELGQSKVAISPFGLGEITLRDFEIFMSGALLFKPDMSQIETWPDLFKDGETMVAHRWDLTDVEEKLEMILSDYPSYLDIAAQGQARYRAHLCGPDAGALFVAHFASILAKAERLAGRR